MVDCTLMERHCIENYSGKQRTFIKGVRVIKKRDYFVQEVTLTGDAPKRFISIYDNNHPHTWRRKNKQHWTQYIAKTGHKWYPNESITEYLLNQLGTIFGIKMADSGLAIINNQLRFLSKYFLDTQKEELVHGAEIFAGYLQDMNMVKQIEKENMAQDMFTLQFVEKAIIKSFPNQTNTILHELVKLLIYDAFVGNNDRHYYNWAVIRPFNVKNEPHFSPVYDTARGLLWNMSDTNLANKVHAQGKEAFIRKYCIQSKPKLGWEGEHQINHFRLLELIYTNEFYITKTEIRHLFNDQMLQQMQEFVRTHFANLYTSLRVELINSCLEYRYNEIKKLLI